MKACRKKMAWKKTNHLATAHKMVRGCLDTNLLFEESHCQRLTIQVSISHVQFFQAAASGLWLQKSLECTRTWYHVMEPFQMKQLILGILKGHQSQVNTYACMWYL